MINAHSNTLSNIRSKEPRDVKISELTRFEMLYGIHRNPQMNSVKRRAIMSFLEDVEAIPFGPREAETAARVRSHLFSIGQPIGAYDVLIAATALAGNYIMVTSNSKEFQRVPELVVENWRE